MPVRVVHKADLVGTNRHVRNDAYETHRFLLASDGAGVTVTDIVLRPGVPAVYGYDNHVEIAYCVEGGATIADLGTGVETPIGPGSLWIAGRGDRFRFEAHEPTRLICVFHPPFEGGETGFVGDQ